MKRNIRIRMSIGLVAVLVASYFGWHQFQTLGAETPSVESMKLNNGMNVKFQTKGEQIEIYKNKRWQPFFAKGVNLGATTPGHDPGELATDEKTLMRWFDQIQKMGANVIRVYTIHEPIFYEALVQYNQVHKDNPLYFIQGVWSPEEQMLKHYDGLNSDAVAAFKKEIIYAVGAVYGDVTIPDEKGKASGNYKINAGPYLLGWSVGTEWDPELVDNTDKVHKGMPPFQGSYYKAKDNATPFESMLAEMLNTLATFESKEGWQHPLTFTNWVTTDPLKHPGEVERQEDLVSVDAAHIQPTNWQAGYFASFHAYPYYPDFFRFDKTLNTVKNDQGKTDTYKAYLRQLKQHFKGMPIMITEFGVPSSLGVGHLTGLGRNQGGHTEQEQGKIDADLYHQIVQEKYAGAILFEWQDEWFKRAWNTIDYSMPANRRKDWLNVLSNEEQFGVDGFYSSKDGQLKIDGNIEDWKKISDKKEFNPNVPGWKNMSVTHDEAYLYIAAELDHRFDPSKETLYIGTDTVKGGNRHAKELGNRKLNEGLETLISIGKQSQITMASNYDFNTRLWGEFKGNFPVNSADMKDDSGRFTPWELIIDKKSKPPMEVRNRPYKDIQVGHLRRGTTDPADPNYNSLAMWQAKGNIVEMRIPWMLLGFSDPSSLDAINYSNEGNQLHTENVQGLHLVPWMVDGQTNQLKGLGDGKSIIDVSKMPMYTWQPWDQVNFQERLKKSYGIMQQAFQETP
jgi:hypothetical protein